MPKLKVVKADSSDLAEETADLVREARAFAHCLDEDCAKPLHDRDAGNRRVIMSAELMKRLDALDITFRKLHETMLAERLAAREAA